LLAVKRDSTRERLGFLPRTAGSLSHPVWIHAASVGETLAAKPLVEEIRRRLPGLSIVFSTTSLTGRAVASREIAPDLVTLLPLDVLGTSARALGRIRPRCLVLVETEIWPGLLRAAGRLGVPVVVVSGRLSEPALRRYRLVAPLFRAALSNVAAFGMQTDGDAARVVSLGVAGERVRVTGSLKASRRPENVEPPVGEIAARPLLVAASTQPGEEELVLDACRNLWAAHPDLLVLIAPRRPERFAGVARLVAERGIRYERRSSMGGAVRGETQVLVLDSVGELTRFFPAARAVFVGGTVAPLGGHNILEPATHARPVAFGPHTENVAGAAAALIASGGGEVVRNAADLERFWRRMLDDRPAAEETGLRARRAAEEGAAVIERTWELLAPFLGADR
jgi:3-deoxy-D-manno-octulosonic-acid transferase